MAKVFINPGHGGTDPGAIGPTGYWEATCVKAVADILNVKLQSVGISTHVYQSGTLSGIAGAANAWRADWFVSIHCNSSAGTPGTGTETYHYPGSAQGQAFAAVIQAELVKKLGRANRGVKSANFQVLRDTAMPAILTELLFINNPVEEALLKTPACQENAAEALAIGICRHLGVTYPNPLPPTLYRVQAGAFSVRANAENMLALVKAAGFTSAIIREVSGVFCVQVGAYSIRANAEAMLALVLAAGFSGIIKEG
ncbi:MAG: N-acetylmuramoyl-L-alanine amidase [Peptococcaceae bacterium]|nr:N-acetylmuramoyl-L-alanine amidase [Peptococcaceae bacterium]